jgi:tripartite ATP-independent transporter DctM subunit
MTVATDAADNARAPDIPRWLRPIDSAVIVILNVTLVLEVLLVFAGTMVRTFTNSSALMGLDETSHPFLITIAFLGGAVSYSRGHFIAITLLVERAPPAWREFLGAGVEWLVILIAALIGSYSVPLLIANAEEKTVLLGISYAWLTLPMTVGSALFVLHAGLALLRRRPVTALATLLAVVALIGLFWLTKDALGTQPRLLYLMLAGLFLGLVAIGAPIGFVLATVGIACVFAAGSADMIGVVMNAQRGSSGFIFLALPFFILAGFITDRADIGARIVNFVAALIGHVRGGLLQVMIVGVYISSSISGSKAADMATIGIPMSRRLAAHGYAPHECAAVLAAAAAMAESVPPSIALILVGSATSISTGGLFVAGILPAAVLAVCLMVLVRIRASIYGWAPTERAPRAEVLRAGGRAILPMLMPVILIGGIITGVGTPTEVSTFAVVYGLALGLLYRGINPRNFWQILTDASMLNGMIFFTISAATIFSWALTLEGVTVAIAQFVSGLGAAAFLPALIVITVLMGALLESFVTIVILAPLLLPVATQLGINPLQYGIVMTEAFGIGSILPPIGIALYVACTICGARVERASGPLTWYLAVMFVGLLLVASVPWITTVLPTLLNFKG